MAVAIHILNKPNSQTREQYESAWKQLEEQNAVHPEGRQSHISWLVGDQIHVLDVWDSQEHFEAFLQTLGPILEESGMELAGAPEVGELLRIVVPD